MHRATLATIVAAALLAGIHFHNYAGLLEQ